MKTMTSITLLLLFVCCARADQLQWNSSQITAKAIPAIRPNSVLISYCSEADNVRVELWRVMKVVSTTTPNEDLFGITVFAKRLFVSKETFSRGTYREPVTFMKAVEDPTNTIYSDLHILQEIDLAYVYVPDEKNAFVCLGRKLNLECSVLVEKISLPDSMIRQLTARTTRQDHRGNKTSIVIDYRGDIINERELSNQASHAIGAEAAPQHER
jgi:hypothetical protein